MKAVEIKDLGSDVAELVKAALAGEEVILADHKCPVIRFMPVGAGPGPSERKAGLGRGTVLASPDFDAPLPPDFLLRAG